MSSSLRNELFGKIMEINLSFQNLKVVCLNFFHKKMKTLDQSNPRIFNTNSRICVCVCLKGWKALTEPLLEDERTRIDFILIFITFYLFTNLLIIYYILFIIITFNSNTFTAHIIRFTLTA